MATPQRLSDRYELGEILGFGGMSEVHLGRDVRLHRDVAVKVLRADLARDPSFYLRFRREAQNAAALNHPAIVAVHDSGEAETPDGRVPYIVMEYVDGVTLRDIVDDSGPIEPQRAIEIVADACQALNYSHQHRIIHRDVKPANIMINTAGAVKVMDFGIARALHDDGVKLTQTSAVIGTAQYLSPEQANGDPVDARSDVYSLGCVLYELLTGEPPFVGESPVSLAYQHVRKVPMPPSRRNADLSPELDAVVLKALAKNPDNRYQSAAEMRTDLIRVRVGEAPDAPKVFTDADRTNVLSSSLIHRTVGRIDGGPTRRWLMAAALLAVLAVAVTVAVNVAIGNRQRVPNVRGQAQADAQVSLQNLGFKTVINAEPNSTVRRGLVISTDPDADTTARLDDTVTINVSSGSEQRKVPDVSNLSPSDATERLKAAGFREVDQTEVASPTMPKGVVIGTSPPADTSSTVTDRITIAVSSGPGTRLVPDVITQTVDLAKTNLTIVGFTTILTAPMDSTLPTGQVAATDPPAGTDLPIDGAITLKVSTGNQFSMPDLSGFFYTDLEPLLRQNYGFTGQILKGADIQAGDQNRNKVVHQTPAPNTGVNRDGTVTVSYGS
ncbi:MULTISPECIES: Stk1 family PASTA domain-containing Ser/Thr kinase [unclassified Mycobacterium]|uniref:Stk1 family PASTA domain-containing Ser/Thr kinase n=1 Tax=unclassified Mycobacterium TaxID=2642494 RepID=UPI0029C766D6|nr:MULTISPECIES: Stk1 family PASTA domain-containing Ser/Thr kinase [unclassified Mycobacterium]